MSDGLQVGQVSVLVYDDPHLLFVEPKLSGSEQQHLIRLNASFGFRSIGDFSFNVFGEQEKWFQDRMGAYFNITPDGILRRWTGGQVLDGEVIAKVTPIVYDNPHLLIDAHNPLSAPDLEELGQLQMTQGFRFTGDFLFNGLHQQEIWFHDSNAEWFNLTPDGTLRKWTGGPVLEGDFIARLDPRVYHNPNWLFEAKSVVTTTGVSAPTRLSDNDLQPILAAARDRWVQTGVTAQQLATLDSIAFEITNLDNYQVTASQPGRIFVDDDAGGKQWFVDPTPSDDREFANIISSTHLQSATPTGQLDLLTSVMHAMGNQLGLANEYGSAARDDVMYGFLGADERRFPTTGQAQSVTENAHTISTAQLIPIDLGDLPPESAVDVVFRALVNPTITALTAEVATQGTMVGVDSGTQIPFTPAKTDDPDQGGNIDSTLTFVDADPDIHVTVSVSSANPGDVAILTFVQSNLGNQDASGVFLTVQIPSGATVDPNLSSPGWQQQPDGSYRFDSGDMPAGSSTKFTLAVKLDDNLSVGTKLNFPINVNRNLEPGENPDLALNQFNFIITVGERFLR